jgi:AcrR family transcriptional regulator
MNKTTTKKLNTAFEKKPAIKSQDLIPIVGSRANISRLVKEGKLYPLGSGYYSKNKSRLIDKKLSILNNYYPSAVLIGHNALYLHGVFSRPIDEIEVQIDSEQSLRNALFKVRRVKKERMVGATLVPFNEGKLRTYPLEKILCILSKSKTTQELFHSALKNIRKRKMVLNETRIRKFDIDLETKAHEKIFSEKSTAKAKKSTAKPTRKSRQKRQASREEIVTAAKALFVETGLHGTSLRQISDYINIDLTSLTRHFKSRYDLKQAICDQRLAELEATFYEYSPPEELTRLSPVEQLQFFIRGTMDNVDRVQGGEEFRFQAWAIAEQHNTMYSIVKCHCQPALAYISNLILTENSEISPVEAEVRAGMLLLTMDGYNYLKWIYIDAIDFSTSKMEFLENYKNMIVNLIVPRCFE